jgi:hypothetical protein
MILVAYRHGFRPAELVDLRLLCTSAGSSRALQARIRSSATNCGPYGGCNASRSPSHPSCSPRNADRPSRLPGSPAWSSAQVQRQGLGSRSTRTCCDMPVDTHWLTEGTTRGHCRLTSGTATSSTRCATRSCRRRASRTFGANEHFGSWRFRRLTGSPFDDSGTLWTG